MIGSFGFTRVSRTTVWFSSIIVKRESSKPSAVSHISQSTAAMDIADIDCVYVCLRGRERVIEREREREKERERMREREREIEIESERER